METSLTHVDLSTIHHLALSWYDQHQRILPWRQDCDPYKVLVSEFMLQQTTVPTVLKRFQPFLDRFPTIVDLANATQHDVMCAWQGLGYYRRAVSLHQSSQKIAQDFGGKIPSTYDELIQLPGIGPYIAAAVGSICYDQKTIAFDTNVSRVMARFFSITLEKNERDRIFRRHAHLWAKDLERIGDFNQALMDIASAYCGATTAQCGPCPLSSCCLSSKKDWSKKEKNPLPKKPIYHTWARILTIPSQQFPSILLHRRTKYTLLRNMVGVGLGTHYVQDQKEFFDDPHTMHGAFLRDEKNLLTYLHEQDIAFTAQEKKTITHQFTHFTAVVQVKVYHLNKPIAPLNQDMFWAFFKDLDSLPLPTLMKKIIAQY
jgi:A/G-specific adenine glycosylase